MAASSPMGRATRIRLAEGERVLIGLRPLRLVASQSREEFTIEVATLEPSP